MKKCLILTFFSFFCLTFNLRAENKEDYEKVYKIVQDEYVDKISLERFAVAGIKALSSMDAKIKIDQAYDNLSFAYADGKPKIFRKPRDKKSASGWAETTANIVDAAIKSSPELSLKDYEVFDVVNEASFAVLDEFSRYFPSLEEEDENVKIKKYFGARMIDDVLYIKVKTFNKVTFGKIKQALSSNAAAKGLILDLRGNRGGMFSEAVKTADLFLDKGSLIVSTKGKEGMPAQTYTAKEDDLFEDKPIVIMVDGNTASSAEMLASALKDQSRAHILGTKTFGKGSVQNLRIISEDKGFALTNAYFYSPQENKIHKLGIMPDVCLGKDKKCRPQSREDKAEDIDFALEFIKKYL